MTAVTRRPSPEALISLVLLAAVCGAFGRALQAGFVFWDDDVEIYANPHLKGITPETLRWMFFGTGYVVRYQPLTWLTWELVYEVFGRNPMGYHLASLLFHCMNTGLVFLLIRKLMLLIQTEKLSDAKRNYLLVCAGLGTLFWAIHPFLVEAVAWASAFLHCQALFFLLIAALCYLEAASRPASDRWRKLLYWISVGSFAASLLSYPIGLGFVLIVIVLDFYPLKRLPGSWRDTAARRVWLEKLPFVGVAGLVLGITLLLRFNTSGHWPRPVSLGEFGVLARTMQALYIWAYYFWRPWYPVDLTPYYTTLLTVVPTEPRFLFSAALVIGLTAWLALRRRKWPGPLALWLCHLILLVPVLGLTEQPHFPSDRYSFIVGITWSVLLTAGLMKYGQLARLRLVSAGAAVVILCGLGTLSYQQTGIWQNSVVLHQHMIRLLGNHPRRLWPYLRLGNVYMEQGNDEQAAECFRRVLEIDPASQEGNWYLATALHRQGKLEEAITRYRRALSLNPDNFRAHNNLGLALAKQGKMDEAVAQWLEAVRIEPGRVNVHRNLARALTELGRIDEAKQQEVEAARLELQQNKEAQ